MNDQNQLENDGIKICKQSLLKNHFNVILAEHPLEAKRIIINEFIPKLKIETVSWGDSLTVIETGILEELEKAQNITFIQTFNDNIKREEIIQKRKKALTVDLFITGSNALTKKGQLVNLDMVAITYIIILPF